MGARLFEKYKKEVIPALQKKFGYKNIMQVPKLEKVVLNIGVGDAIQDKKMLEAAVKELAMITGQKPVITKAKKSISNFKLRTGMAIGCFVTLRRDRMYEFIDRFFNLAIPRIKDFRGLSRKSFDGRGNYNVGIREQIIFPEIVYDEVIKIRGLEIAFVSTARTDEEAMALLEFMGMPFTKIKKKQ